MFIATGKPAVQNPAYRDLRFSFVAERLERTSTSAYRAMAYRAMAYRAMAYQAMIERLQRSPALNGVGKSKLIGIFKVPTFRNPLRNPAHANIPALQGLRDVERGGIPLDRGSHSENHFCYNGRLGERAALLGGHCPHVAKLLRGNGRCRPCAVLETQTP